MRRKVLCAVLLTAAAATATFAGPAAADRVYHTERLELSGVGGAPGGGMVVNIHANGPQVYAHEIYVLRHVVPGTYQVVLTVFPTSQDCTGTSMEIPTAMIETNATGNGRADVKFTPEAVAPFRGTTVSIRWAATGPATYVTDCTAVTLD
jgi:hypothetical protein